MPELLLRAEQLGKAYPSGRESHWVFRHLDIEIFQSQSLSLTGPSGSGKSSLLNVLGLLTNPSEGKLDFKRSNISTCPQSEIEALRAKSIGFVFQKHLLLPELNLLENICLPLAQNLGWSHEVLTLGKSWLQRFQLDHRAKANPSQLSGGEAQRGAIIRALIHKPELLLLDEPTGNLDPDLSHVIIDLLLDHAKANGCAVVLVTHNMELAKKTERQGDLRSHRVTWTTA